MMALISAGADIDSTTSRWTALTFRQVNSTIQHFFLVFLLVSLISNGPARSAPLTSKGVPTVVLSVGNGPIIWFCGCL